MRIISVNLNKRLGNRTTARSVASWLDQHAADIVIVQEPWAHSRPETIDLDGYLSVGGNSNVYAWTKAAYATPNSRLLGDNWLQLDLGYLLLNDVYFSAYSARDRRSFFEKLISEQATIDDRPQAILGDFNFAPEPNDGMDGERVSSFTSTEERVAFRRLLATGGLIDITAPKLLGQQEFTIVRHRNDKASFFRCDLALITDYIADSVAVKYDHSVRVGPTAFTDHSALVIDVPVASGVPGTFVPREME